MRNSVKAVLAAIAAIGVPALFAAPANAGSGPPVVGCTTGSSCSVELHYWWPVTGSTGGTHPVHVQPPPCIGVPVGDTYAGSQVIVSIYGTTAPVPSPTTASPSATASATPTPTSTSTSTPAPSGLTPQQQQVYDKAQHFLKTTPDPVGEWYQIAGNPNASATDQQACSTLPPYVWVPQGGTLPVVNGAGVLPSTLAAWAYSQLQTGQINSVRLNPRGTSDTNLPTFVNAILSLPRHDPGLLEVSGPNTKPGVGRPYVWATAATPNGTAATVWAWVRGFNIDVSPAAGAKISNDPQCTTASGTKTMPWGATGYKVGSRYTRSQMKKVGVGQSIDCGATFSAPGTYTLTVRFSWGACWTQGLATTPGPPAGKDAAGNDLCQPVPGAGGLKDSKSNITIQVREIQSVNG